MTSRRGFLKGLVAGSAIIAAPALAREGILMPVSTRFQARHSSFDFFLRILEEQCVEKTHPRIDKFLREFEDKFYCESSITELSTNTSLTPLKYCGDTIHFRQEPVVVAHEERSCDQLQGQFLNQSREFVTWDELHKVSPGLKEQLKLV